MAFNAGPSGHPAQPSVSKPINEEAPEEPAAKLAAARTDHRVEVTSRRTEHGTFFTNPSNDMTLELNTEPVPGAPGCWLGTRGHGPLAAFTASTLIPP